MRNRLSVCLRAERRLAAFILLTASFFTISCVTGRTALAFKPMEEYGHVGIARDGIKNIEHLTQDGRTLKFTERAIREIRDATAGVDEIVSPRGEIFDATAHCDNELIPECTSRIRDIRKNIVAILESDELRDGAEARRQLGRALHTLQDFYSHSNWVELGNSKPNPYIGTVAIGRLEEDIQTCDFLWNSTLEGAGLTNITTGYFEVGLFPAGKCAHGLFDGTGIHKDKPGRPNHEDAREVAVDATKLFVESIIKDPRIRLNDFAIAEFMGISGATVGLVVDDTGSMGPEIEGIRSIAQDLITVIERAPEFERPTTYLLQRFGDPDVGEPFLTNDPAKLLEAVNDIVPTAGGDCPERANTGLLSAIAAVGNGSYLYFFSDASSKDGDLANFVAAAANKKKTAIYYFLTGTCSPVDPAYLKVANETGGQAFLAAYGTDVAKFFGFIESSLKGNLTPLLLARDYNNGWWKEYSVPVDSTIDDVTFTVASDNPYSSTIMQVIRPNGRIVRQYDSDVTAKTLTAFTRIMKISSPASGNWRVRVAAFRSNLSVSVLGNSALTFENFSFVEERGRSEHTGLFPIFGHPVDTDELKPAVANVTGLVGTATFEMRNESGKVIEPIQMSLGGSLGEIGVAAEDYIGQIPLPTEPFRIYARGIDSNGKAFIRAFPKLFLGRTVSIRPYFGVLETVPGGTFNVKFSVQNHGALNTFEVSGVPTIGQVVDVSPSSITLDSGEKSDVSVVVQMPHDVMVGSRGLVSVEVRGMGGEQSSNVAVVDVEVTDAGAMEVAMDVKPGSMRNVINLGSRGVIPVAILSSSRSNGDPFDFDATMVDPTTVSLSGSLLRGRGYSVDFGSSIDINRDGLLDLFVHFETEDLKLSPADARVQLEGKTLDGVAIFGSDVVTIVPKSK